MAPKRRQEPKAEAASPAPKKRIRAKRDVADDGMHQCTLQVVKRPFDVPSTAATSAANGLILTTQAPCDDGDTWGCVAGLVGVHPPS